MTEIGNGVLKRAQTVRRSARFDRVRARAPRYIFVAAIAITCALGVRSLVAPPNAIVTADQVVVDNASEDFAQRFARAYLTFDGEHPGQRQRLLRPLVPEDYDLGADSPHGRQEVLWTQVASNQEALAGGRVVVVAVGVTTQDQPVYLAVPVMRVAGAIALGAYPAIVGPPVTASTPMPAREHVDDPRLAAVARRAVGNYLAGDVANLKADLASDAIVSPPKNPLRLRAIEELEWAEGEGSGAVLATVSAADSRGTAWTLTYEVGIARERGRLVVTFVETVPTAP